MRLSEHNVKRKGSSMADYLDEPSGKTSEWFRVNVSSEHG